MVVSYINVNRASQVALVVKNPRANAGDIRDRGSILGSGRSSGGRHGNPLQYCCQENPMNRGAGLQSMGHKESDMTGVTQHAHIRIKLHILFDIFILKLTNIHNIFFFLSKKP